MEQNYKDETKKLNCEEKVKNNKNIIELNEIIYNTYYSFQDNYFNAINIKKI